MRKSPWLDASSHGLFRFLAGKTDKSRGGPIPETEGIWLEYKYDPTEFHPDEDVDENTEWVSHAYQSKLNVMKNDAEVSWPHVSGSTCEKVSLQTMDELYEEVRQARITNLNKEIEDLRAKKTEEEKILRKYMSADLETKEQIARVKELQTMIGVKEAERDADLRADRASIESKRAKLLADCEDVKRLMSKSKFNELRAKLDTVLDYIMICSKDNKRDGIKIIKGGEIVYRMTEEEIQSVKRKNQQDIISNINKK